MVVTILIGFLAVVFSILEYGFQAGWKKRIPPEGTCRFVCRMWNVDRHLFNNITHPFNAPEGFNYRSYSSRHVIGRRGWVAATTITAMADKPGYPAILREYLDEEMAWYSRERSDGKPAVRIEAYIITPDGVIHHPTPKSPEKEVEN